MMLHERCLQVKYEDLCADFRPVARRILEFAGAPDVEAAIRVVEPTMHARSVGKHRSQSARDQRKVMAIVKPLLLSLGYLADDPERPRRSVWHSHFVDRVLDRLRAARR